MIELVSPQRPLIAENPDYMCTWYNAGETQRETPTQCNRRRVLQPFHDIPNSLVMIREKEWFPMIV